MCTAYSDDGDEVLIGEHLEQEVRGQLHEAERLPERAAAPAFVGRTVSTARGHKRDESGNAKRLSVPVLMSSVQAHVSMRRSTSFAPVIANWYLQVSTCGTVCWRWLWHDRMQ